MRASAGKKRCIPSKRGIRSTTRRRKIFSPEFLAQLARHPWPGNVRQLRNLIERLVVTVRASEIGVELAPPVPSAAPAKATAELFAVAAGSSIAEVESRLIRETISRVTSNRREAAQILGLSPCALAYKLKLLHLAPGRLPLPASANGEMRPLHSPTGGSGKPSTLDGDSTRGE